MFGERALHTRRKGFNITLKSEQKKAIRQLYEEKYLLAVHFVHFEI